MTDSLQDRLRAARERIGKNGTAEVVLEALLSEATDRLDVLESAIREGLALRGYPSGDSREVLLYAITGLDRGAGADEPPDPLTGTQSTLTGPERPLTVNPADFKHASTTDELPQVPMRHEFEDYGDDLSADRRYHNAMVAWVRQVAGLAVKR